MEMCLQSVGSGVVGNLALAFESGQCTQPAWNVENPEPDSYTAMYYSVATLAILFCPLYFAFVL